MKRIIYLIISLVGLGFVIYINFFQADHPIFLIPVFLMGAVVINVGMKLAFESTMRFEILVWILTIIVMGVHYLWYIPSNMTVFFYILFYSGMLLGGAVLFEFVYELVFSDKVYPFKSLYFQSVIGIILSLILMGILGLVLRAVGLVSNVALTTRLPWIEISSGLFFVKACLIYLSKMTTNGLARAFSEMIQQPIRFGTILFVIICAWIAFRFAPYLQAMVYIPWPLVIFFAAARGLKRAILPSLYLCFESWRFILEPFLMIERSPILLMILTLQLIFIHLGLGMVLLFIMEWLNNKWIALTVNQHR